MPRHQVSSKIRLEIKAYKRINPKATLTEIANEFEKKIGRVVQKATIMNILKEDGGLSGERVDLLLDQANNKMAQSLANKIARMGINRQEIVAKATDLLNLMLDNENTIGVNEAVKVLTETTKIDQVLKGQPSEIHKVVRGIDDETLEFLANFKPNAIPGEIIPDVPTVPGEFDEISPGGAGEETEGGEDKILRSE